MHLDSMLSSVSLGRTSEEHPYGPRWALSRGIPQWLQWRRWPMSRNIPAVTEIVADKLPRNCAGSQTSMLLGSRSVGFKNLKLSKALNL